MPQRKVWNEQQDKILRFLKEEQGQSKWSVIAKKMESDFGIQGRTGKQCRQRYHNHLDKYILTTSWNREQEQILLQIHEQVGNKWSTISQKLQGRSDNCVKNHFYSKMRKSMRRLNKLINEYFKKDYRQIKITTLYAILQICQNSFKNNSKYDQEFIQHCQDIKKELYLLDSYLIDTSNVKKGVERAKRLIIELIEFQNKQKKNSKSNKQHQDSTSTRIKQQKNEVKREKTDEELYWILKRVCQEFIQKQQ